MKGLKCTFSASYYSARLSWTLDLPDPSPVVQDKKKKSWGEGEKDIRDDGALRSGLIIVITRVKCECYRICKVSKMEN